MLQTVQILKGLATLIPGVYPALQRLRGTQAPNELHTAPYHYTVWLRHLVKAHENGLSTEPRVVAELGPGSSLGTGLAALLTGAESYHAFDIIQHATTQRNLSVFDALVELFRRRADLPGDEEFPEVAPKLASYRFPHHILTAERLSRTLAAARIASLRRSVAAAGLPSEARPERYRVRYVVPWHGTEIVDRGSVDMILSQAVLEHVDELALAYDGMFQWLKPGGIMSHVIDYRCHGTAEDWNGHWTYPDFAWKLIRGRRPFFINRAMHSHHVDLMKQTGMEIVAEETVRQPSGIKLQRFAPQYRSPTDVTTAVALVQASKPIAEAR